MQIGDLVKAQTATKKDVGIVVQIDEIVSTTYWVKFSKPQGAYPFTGEYAPVILGAYPFQTHQLEAISASR